MNPKKLTPEEKAAADYQKNVDAHADARTLTYDVVEPFSLPASRRGEKSRKFKPGDIATGAELGAHLPEVLEADPPAVKVRSAPVPAPAPEPIPTPEP